MARGFFIGIFVMIVVGILAVITIGQSIWQGVSKYIIQTPDQVNTIAYSIADFDLPAGYSPDYAVEFLGFSLVAYKPDDDHSHIMLLQAPTGVHINQQELEQQLDTGRQSSESTRMTTIRSEQRTVRGEDATLVLSEGQSGDGTSIRQYSMMFEGNQGTALLLVTEPVSRWEWDAVDAFIASIH